VNRPIRAGREKPEDILLDALIGGEGYIERMEARGQQELVASTKLPIANAGGYGEPDDAPYLALGFEFGEVDPDDPIFREATLPNGWEKRGTEHSMHSTIVDERGEERVGIFFKAAFYDRHAHMYLIRQCSCGHSSNSHPYVDGKYPGPYSCEKCDCDGAPLVS
jgi:hypothetical protein